MISSCVAFTPPVFYLYLNRRKTDKEMPLINPDDRTKTPEANPGGGAIGLIIAFLLVAVSAVVIYSASMHGPFVLDDEFIIVNNPLVHDITSIWPPIDPRYIGYLTYGLNYSLGGLDTFGYHLVNVAIHIINGLLVYLLAISLFRAARSAGYSAGGEGASSAAVGPVVPVAIVSALLFTVHPINIQGVTYIVQRFASLATLFYLLSLVLYLEWSRASFHGPSKGRPAALYVLSLLSAVAAQKTKEIAFTLPFVIILLEFGVFGAKEGEGLKKRLACLVPFLLTLFIIPLSMYATELARPAPAGAARQAGQATDVARFVPGDLKHIPPYDYLVTQFRVLMTYLRLIVLPVGQTLEYDYTVYRTLLSPGPFLSLFFHIGAFLGAAFLFIRARRGRDILLLLMSFGIVFFYITISIESSIIPLRDVIFEHRVYLPSVGLFISFSAAFFYAWRRVKGGSSASPAVAAAVLLCLTALPLAYASYMRNLVWSDKMALYQDTAAKSPGNARVRNNLGVEYGKLGMYKEAIREFEATLKIQPDFIETYKNLANAYYHSGRPDEAIGVYVEVLKLAPGDKVALRNLADLYYEVGLVKSAIKEYGVILGLYPDNVDARNNLANIFLSEGQLEDAVREYEKVLSIKPDHAEAVYNMAISLEKAGDRERAAHYYRRFLEIAPPEYQSYKDEIRGRLTGTGPR